MKKFGVAVLTVSLALTAACSNNEEAASEDKETKQTEETTKNTNITKKTEPEKEPQEQGEKESESEEYTLIEEMDIAKRDEVLYKNEKGSLILLGETLDPEGKLVAAVKATGELKNIKINQLSMKFITNEGDEYTLDSDNLEDYRAKDNSLIWVFKSSLEVAGSSLKRMDYSLNGHVDEEDAKVKTLMLKDTTATEAIPALKEIPYYDVPNMNITRENEDYKLNITSMSLDPEESKDITFRGTIEPKKDMDFGEEFEAIRPALHEQVTTLIELPQSQLYKGVPVDFTLSAHFKTPIGKDKGAIINFGTATMGFSVNAASGKEYKNNKPISLIDLPEMYGTNGMGEIPIEGYTDIGGNLYYNIIESSDPNWDWGVGDTSERETIQYALGSNYKKLKVKIGAGSALKDSNGDYDFFIYGDDYNVEQDEEPTGTPLIHEKLKSNSPMKEYEIDVSNVNQLTIYYRTNKAPGSGMGDEDETQKYVQVLVADSELTQ